MEFTAIAAKKNVTVIRIVSSRMLMAYGFMEKLFKIFSDRKTSVDMVTTSEVTVSITIDNDENLDDIVAQLEKIGKVEVKGHKALICVIGAGMIGVPGMLGKIFTVCGKNNINVEMVSQGASEVNTSFIIDQDDMEKAVKVLHKELIEAKL
jgi:aspartate kinase